MKLKKNVPSSHNDETQTLPCRGCTRECSSYPQCEARPWRMPLPAISEQELTIYYDSQCPLCLMEMRQLKRLDTPGHIRFIDLHAEDFQQQFPHIDPESAYNTLHVEDSNGHIKLGLDASCAVWNAVGKHRWINLLRLPLIKPLADLAYRGFARYRGQFAWLLTGKSQCKRCQI